MPEAPETWLRRLFRRPFSPQRFFLLAGGSLGLILVFLIPPFQAPDEHTHFFKEAYASRGGIIAQVLPDRVGAYLPAEYKQTSDRYTYMYLDSEQKLAIGLVKQDLAHPIRDSRPSATAFENTAQYAPLAYAPQATAVTLARAAHGSVLLQLYAARLATVVSWIILVFFAIRKIPFGKWGVVALTLTPLSVFLSASSSNDAVTFGLSLLFISYALAAITGKGRLRKPEGIPLVLLGVALGLCKPPYLILTALALAIPVRRFGNGKHYLKFAALVLGAALLAALAWNALVRHIIINFYPGSDTSAQLHFVLHHPVKTLTMIVKTLVIYPIGDDMLLQLVGLKAWIAAQTPYWLIALDYVTIVLAVLYVPAAQKIASRISWTVRALCGLLAAGGILAVSLLLYLTYTPVGLNSIVGLQGRYFIPFSYLLVGLIGGSSAAVLRLDRRGFRTLQLLIVAIAVSVLPLTISRYYAL